jgi:hypothetical protein
MTTTPIKPFSNEETDDSKRAAEKLEFRKHEGIETSKRSVATFTKAYTSDLPGVEVPLKRPNRTSPSCSVEKIEWRLFLQSSGAFAVWDDPSEDVYSAE